MRNYLRTVARNYGASFKSTLEPPIYFLGGLANSFALAMTLAELLGQPVIVPPHFQGIGALGMAVIARESAGHVNTEPTNASRSGECSVESAYCTGCTNSCELTVVQRMGSAFYLGGRCEGAGKAGITSSASISIPTVSKRDLPKRGRSLIQRRTIGVSGSMQAPGRSKQRFSTGKTWCTCTPKQQLQICTSRQRPSWRFCSRRSQIPTHRFT